jgi:aminodeoxyfutalosine synthase
MSPIALWNSPLAPIYDRVAAGVRLEPSDALQLLESTDLNAVGAIGDAMRRLKNGNRASYILNAYVNYSNYCILSCQFCAFARKKRNADGFELTLDEIVTKAQAAVTLGATELHIVGGLHPTLPFEWYLEMIRTLGRLEPRPHLKCFTAIEVLHFSRMSRQPVDRVLEQLKEADLDSLTGGGAEIFDADVRDRVARGKESAEEWLDVHRTWHRLGGRSTCTMLFGHVETLAHRVDHLTKLRALQDETGGFTGFVALPYHPDNNEIPVDRPPSAADTLRTIAASRAFLDNIPHVTAYWVGMGLRLAQVALNYGADDLHGTIQEEHIFHMAGAGTPQGQTKGAMIQAIREAGLVPVRRNTFYETIEEAPAGGTDASEPRVPMTA